MSLRADRREWNDLAREDGMWAVYSDPQRRGTWTVEEFLATGEAEIASVMVGLEARDAMPRLGRALDFGCGLGRLTRALAGRFDEVTGVDASKAMIAEAEHLNAGATNCRFVLNEQPVLAALPTESYDFVLSLITLQHVSSRVAIRRYIREFVRVAAPGGIIVFQLPTSVGWQIRLHPLRLCNRALRAVPVAPRWALRSVMSHSMRVMALPESEVRSILTSCGAEIVDVVADNRTGTAAAPSRTYVARRPAARSSRGQ